MWHLNFPIFDNISQNSIKYVILLVNQKFIRKTKCKVFLPAQQNLIFSRSPIIPESLCWACWHQEGVWWRRVGVTWGAEIVHRSVGGRRGQGWGSRGAGGGVGGLAPWLPGVTRVQKLVVRKQVPLTNAASGLKLVGLAAVLVDSQHQDDHHRYQEGENKEDDKEISHKVRLLRRTQVLQAVNFI